METCESWGKDGRSGLKPASVSDSLWAVRRTLSAPLLALSAVLVLGSCQQDDSVPVACRDLAARTANAAMDHGAAVRMYGSRRVDAAYARLDSLKDRYATEGCSRDYLRYVIRHAGLAENDRGVPATDRPRTSRPEPKGLW